MTEGGKDSSVWAEKVPEASGRTNRGTGVEEKVLMSKEEEG